MERSTPKNALLVLLLSLAAVFQSNPSYAQVVFGTSMGLGAAREDFASVVDQCIVSLSFDGAHAIGKDGLYAGVRMNVYCYGEESRDLPFNAQTLTITNSMVDGMGFLRFQRPLFGGMLFPYAEVSGGISKVMTEAEIETAGSNGSCNGDSQTRTLMSDKTYVYGSGAGLAVPISRSCQDMDFNTRLYFGLDFRNTGVVNYMYLNEEQSYRSRTGACMFKFGVDVVFR